jgi:hypothetical protein
MTSIGLGKSIPALNRRFSANPTRNRVIKHKISFPFLSFMIFGACIAAIAVNTRITIAMAFPTFFAAYFLDSGA